MRDSDERQLDAYLDGELTPAGQRELAQAALDDPELFDALAVSAVLKATAADAPAVARPRWTGARVKWMVAGAAAAAAAIAVVMVNVDRGASNGALPSSGASVGGPKEPDSTSTAPVAGMAPQPVILAARAGDLTGQPTPQFRTAADASRAPKEAGVVVAVEGGEVAIDLGSLDGVVKGSELPVVHDGSNARLTISIVFRERSRGRVNPTETIRAGDRVDVPAAMRLDALLEHALSRRSVGDADAARAIASRAVAASASAASAESADTMNELAALLIEARDYDAAETLLRRAQASAVRITAVRVTNNLAALTALRGNAGAAEAMYRSALTMGGSGPEFESARRTIEKNLQDLRPR